MRQRRHVVDVTMPAEPHRDQRPGTIQIPTDRPVVKHEFPDDRAELVALLL